jgi:hypothetical protein
VLAEAKDDPHKAGFQSVDRVPRFAPKPAALPSEPSPPFRGKTEERVRPACSSPAALRERRGEGDCQRVLRARLSSGLTRGRPGGVA